MYFLVCLVSARGTVRAARESLGERQRVIATGLALGSGHRVDLQKRSH